MVGKENDLCTFAFFSDACFLQLVVDTLHFVSVIAFSKLVIELNTKAIIDFVKALAADAIDRLPHRHVLCISILEFNEFFPGFNKRGFIFVGYPVTPFVKSFQFCEWILVFCI